MPAIAAAAMGALLLVGGVNARSDGALLIRGVTVISPERRQPLQGADVLILDGRIAAVGVGPLEVPARVDSLDESGRYLVPGLIDSHVHLCKVPGATSALLRQHPAVREQYLAQQPRSFLYHGFTTVLDMSISGPDGCAGMSAFADAPLAPDLLRCGVVEVAHGFAMSEDDPATRLDDFPYWVSDSANVNLDTVTGHDVAATVQRLQADGFACLKLHYENGFGGSEPVTYETPSVQTFRTLVAEAHRRSMPSFLHATSWESQRFALEIGIDHIAHGAWHWGEYRHSQELPSAIAATLGEVVARRIGYQPTLRVLAGQMAAFDDGFVVDPRLAAVIPPALLGWYDTPEALWYREALREYLPPHLAEIPDARIRLVLGDFLRKAIQVTRWLADAGALLLFGTDTVSGTSWGNPPGLNGYLEMKSWVSAGVPLATLFRAITLDNAKALRIADQVGSVEVGKRANLLLLDADPLRSVSAYGRIHRVILHGNPISRDVFRADAEGLR